MTVRRVVLSLACLALAACAAGPGPDEDDTPTPRPRSSLGGIHPGARVGFDIKNDAPVLGGQAHFVLDPWQRTDLLPNVEVTFLSGLVEYQFNAEGAVFPIAGFYLGGGAAFRNTVYEDDGERETRTGYTLFAGIRPPGGIGRLSPQVELRLVNVARFRPTTITIGLNYPLLVW